jgi:hypothetical protein
MTGVKGQYRGLMASGCGERMAIWIAPISRGGRKSEECRL